MRLSYLLAAGALLACAGVTDTGEPDEAYADSDAGTVEYEGDGAGECTDGADNDRNGAFDFADAGCAGAPDCEEYEPPEDFRYTGAIIATITSGDQSSPCEGGFSVTVGGADGAAVGEATCTGILSGYEIEITGVLGGVVDDTVYQGTWECDTGFSQFTVLLAGAADPSAFVATFEDEIYGGYVFAGSMEGEP